MQEPHGLTSNPIWQWQAYLSESVFYRSEVFAETEKMWQEQARAFHRSRCGNQSARKAAGFVASMVAQGHTVIEVGPGSGLFTTALARRARHVTAIEASPAAVAFLERNLARARVSNVTLLNEAWERSVVGPADFVVAANCLYAFWDIATALTRMACKARREVILVEEVDGGVSDLERSLCRSLGVEPPRFAPPATCFLEVARRLGYEPVMNVLRGVHREWYPSVGAACRGISQRLELPKKVPLAYIHSRLQPHLAPGSLGGVFLVNRAAATAVIRFTPQDSHDI